MVRREFVETETSRRPLYDLAGFVRLERNDDLASSSFDPHRDIGGVRAEGGKCVHLQLEKGPTGHV
jgi:hypothetical protein